MSEFLCDSESLSVSIRAGVSEIDWLVTRLLGELGLDVCSLGDTSLSNRVEGVAGCRGNRASLASGGERWLSQECLQINCAVAAVV